MERSFGYNQMANAFFRLRRGLKARSVPVIAKGGSRQNSVVGGLLPRYCDRFSAKRKKIVLERDLRFNLDENSVSFVTARGGCFPAL